jgi:ribosomal protein S18 acetylase RimI-like enzyme
MVLEILSIYSSNNSLRIGYLNYYKTINHNEVEIMITNVWVEEDYRNRGYGTKLLRNFFERIKKEVETNQNIHRICIELDDMTDKAHQGSIYEKFGFEYKEDIYPEMIMEKMRTEFIYYVEHNIGIE